MSDYPGQGYWNRIFNAAPVRDQERGTHDEAREVMLNESTSMHLLRVGQQHGSVLSGASVNPPAREVIEAGEVDLRTRLLALRDQWKDRERHWEGVEGTIAGAGYYAPVYRRCAQELSALLGDPARVAAQQED